MTLSQASIWFITVDVNLHHLAKLVFFRLLPCTVISSPVPLREQLTPKELGVMLHLLRVEHELLGILLYETFVCFLQSLIQSFINISVDSLILILYFLL